MHIVENITLDINEMFVMYLLTIYEHNEEFPMDVLCQILRKYRLYDMAAEFAAKLEKFRLHKVNLNCKQSITLICNFEDIMNEILTLDILSVNDKFILNTFKFFIYKNANYITRLWIMAIKTDEECD